MKRVLSTIVAAAMLFGNAYAIDGIKGKSAILMSQEGEVIWESNADEKLEPASVTKIMTMILIAEAIESGKIKREDMVTASEHASSMGGSEIWLKTGEQLSVNDLFKVVSVVSANDAAVALAEYVGGTEENFVAMMNKKAEELGMSGTHFVNCNGLPAEGPLTTARDIGIMTCEALKHSIIFEFTTIWMDYIRDGKSVLVNTNKMIRTYSGMTGLKTGFTKSAGYCLSATAFRDGLGLIAVVMQCGNVNDRTADISAMLNYGFASYKKVDISKKLNAENVKVMLGKSESVGIYLENQPNIIVKKGTEEELVYNTEIETELLAPVQKGQIVGKITVTHNNDLIKEINIVAKDEVQRLTLFDIYRNLIRKLVSR